MDTGFVRLTWETSTELKCSPSPLPPGFQPGRPRANMPSRSEPVTTLPRVVQRAFVWHTRPRSDIGVPSADRRASTLRKRPFLVRCGLWRGARLARGAVAENVEGVPKAYGRLETVG